MKSLAAVAAVASLWSGATALADPTSPAAADDEELGAFGIEVDAAQLMADVTALAADDMEGRRSGTPGSARARAYIAQQFEEAGILPIGDGYVRSFAYQSLRRGARVDGANVIGRIEGARSDRVIVVSAHYDHLGVINGEVFNGADDNASGVAALLEIARSFDGRRPAHTLVFAAFDAEEDGRAGARRFLVAPPVPPQTIVLNVNLDMVSRSDAEELYAAGGRHAPWLAPWLEWIANDAAVTLLQGHDGRVEGADDWTHESDHAAFHDAGVPFVYFGVEDHPDYHRPSDDAGTIPIDFFARSVATIVRAVDILDAQLDAIDEARATWEAAADAGSAPP